MGRLESALATSVQGYTLVHAGVVGWRGGAILIPAVRGSGTSTLVGELVRRGAQFYSDEWAALDEAGHVHALSHPTVRRAADAGMPRGSVPPLRELPPLPVTLIVATTYRPRSFWEPVILQGARSLLRIIDKAVMLRSQPARILRLARTLGPGVVTLESPRPEAEAVASALLDFADSLHVRRMAHSPRAQERTAPGLPQRFTPPSGTRPPETLASERPSTDPVTTYAVGGMPRSGTSMMMRALAAGGLEMFADTAKDERMATQWASRRAIGYDPNPHGCHEPGDFWSHDRFPEMIRGRLVKLLGNGVANRRFARSKPIRVAFIYRDREAVARSHLTAFRRAPRYTETASLYRQVLDSQITMQRISPWVQDVTCLAYEDVIRDPLGQFCRLAEIGWPIDPRAAAATVDPTLDRNSSSHHRGARPGALAG